MDGIGRNMRKIQNPENLDDFGSMLSYVHIMNIKINKEGWKQFSRGLTSSSCQLKTLRVHLVEFDRENLQTLAEGIKVNNSITCLDLSYNNLKDSYGDIFSRIITE